MKTLLLQVSFVMIAILASCQKEPMIRFGFDCDFGKDSQGLTMMKVGSSDNTITLTGEISLAEGGVLMQLLNPDGEQVFRREQFITGNSLVNESFPAISGIWRLKYESIDGKGSIRVHMIVKK